MYEIAFVASLFDTFIVAYFGEKECLKALLLNRKSKRPDKVSPIAKSNLKERTVLKPRSTSVASDTPFLKFTTNPFSKRDNSLSVTQIS